MRTVRTYKKLDVALTAWLKAKPYEGRLQPLGIIGKGGYGKTERALQLLNGTKYHYFKGSNSAFGMFQAMRDMTDAPIVFDDMRALLRNDQCVDLMKAACEHRAERLIRWNTRALDEDEREIWITSKVLMILNWVPKDDSDVAAILDRFDVIHFEPTRQEVMAELLRVYPQHKKHIDLISSLDIELSFRAFNCYLDWHNKEQFGENAIENLMEEFGLDQDVLVIGKIIQECHQKTWAEEYQKRTGRKPAAARQDWNRKKRKAYELLLAQGVQLPSEKVKALHIDPDD